MTHPIDPPQSLIDQWLADGCAKHPDGGISAYIARRAAQWGADVELKACREWLEQQTFCGHRDLISALFALGSLGLVAGHVGRALYAAGADAELEACCRSLDSGEHAASYGCHDGNSLREARRPKPLSLKKQAFKALDAIEGDFNTVGDRAAIIRKALEALTDD
jgi:hypothetical protein